MESLFRVQSVWNLLSESSRNLEKSIYIPFLRAISSLGFTVHLNKHDPTTSVACCTVIALNMFIPLSRGMLVVTANVCW